METKDVVRMPLIGKYVEVVEAKNKKLRGVKGKVIDETRNMIKIESNGEKISVIKEQVVLNIYYNNNLYQIPGKKLVGRVEERIKNEN